MSTTQYVTAIGGVQTGITAGTTQTQAGATAITGAFATVTVVGTDDDGVVLPAAHPIGSRVVVANLDAAQDIKVYPASGGTINGAAADTPLVVGQQQVAEFIQIGTGDTWLAILGAVATPA